MSYIPPSDLHPILCSSQQPQVRSVRLHSEKESSQISILPRVSLLIIPSRTLLLHKRRQFGAANSMKKSQASKHGRFTIFYASSSPAIYQSIDRSIKNHGLAACTCMSLQMPFSSARLGSARLGSALFLPFRFGMDGVRGWDADWG